MALGIIPLLLFALPSLGSIAGIAGNGILGEIIIIAIIGIALFFILKIGGTILKIVLGLIINSVLGVMLLLVLDYVLGLGIALSVGLIIPIAIFGLPATGTVVLLKLLGVAVF